ncbi:MAG: hypothetical protein PVF83_07090 [Anaerolineales bacterium]
MSASSFLLPLCLIVVIGLAFLIWLMVTHARDRKDAREVVEMEVTACILKTDGDLLIRQRRFRSLIGLVVGVSLVLGSLLIMVNELTDPAAYWMEMLELLCFGTGLTILGAIVAWISGRGLRSPNLTIHAAGHTVEFKSYLLGKTYTWAFEEVFAVSKKIEASRNMLLNFLEYMVVSSLGGKEGKRTVIGLQHVNGQEVHIGTATSKAARRVPDLLSEILGKPIIKEEDATLVD